MPLASTPLVLPKAHTTIPAANGTVLRFYHGDCVEVMRALEPGDCFRHCHFPAL